MTAQIIPLPRRPAERGEHVYVKRQSWVDQTWLVIHRDHAWLFADFKTAFAEAQRLADALSVDVRGEIF